VLATDNWKLETWEKKAEAAAAGEAINRNIEQDFISAFINRPFDLTVDHPMRVCLYNEGEQKHVLVVTMHHIATDGWSMGILVRELSALYSGYMQDREPELELLPVQYADYAIWQRQYLTGSVLEHQLAYWRNKLHGVEPLQLPTDYDRPPIQSIRGAREWVVLDRTLSEQLYELSSQEGGTLFMILVSVLQVLLWRYSGQQDIVIGSSIAGRRQQEVEGLIGFFVNMIVLRSNLDGDPTYRAFLQQVRATVLEAYNYQDIPFEKVVETVVKQRDRSRSPLFQVMIESESQREERELRLGDLILSAEEAAHNTTKFDLTIIVVERSQQIRLGIEYCTELFSKHTIDRIGRHYQGLLQSVVLSPQERIGNLSMMSEQEQNDIMKLSSGGELNYDPDKTIIQLFREQVKRGPDRTAIIYQGREMSYGQLDAVSDRLGRHLRTRHGIDTDVLVGLMVDRSATMIIGMLAILKAGGAYVPIDVDYPTARRSYIMSDSRIRMLITQTEYLYELGNYEGSIFAIDVELDLIEEEQAGQHDAGDGCERGSTATSDHLAYVIYTSGSTGQPKGCGITHGNLSQYIQWANQHYFGDSRVANFGLYTSLSFDLTVTSIYCTLTLGGCLRVYGQHAALTDILQDCFAPNSGIDSIKLTPSHVNVLKELAVAGPGMKVAILGGEQVTQEHVAVLKAIEAKMEIYNEYGPTETTVGCVVARLELGKAVVIGKPINGARIYILGPGNGLSPIGVPGEICIGGLGLGRGYVGRPDLTALKFVADPFRSGERIYRTGDLGRWMSDGTIAYLGRKDEQVKIRGYRIEPGEIESVVLESGLVSQAVVVAQEEKAGGKRLVGYVVVKGVLDEGTLDGEVLDEETLGRRVPDKATLDKEGLMSYLRERLPEYMVPVVWVELDQIPLTVNGKVDRRSLPEPDAGILSGVGYAAPRNKAERVLAGIWQDLLGVERVGIHDNFFELGGDSIITIQVVSRAKHAGYELGPGDIFRLQTIGELSELLSATTAREGSVPAERGQLTGEVGLLPIQAWFLEKASGLPVGAIDHFNQSVLLDVDRGVGVQELDKAWAILEGQHDVLGMRFERQTGGGWQQYYAGVRSKIRMSDLSGIEPQELAERLRLCCESWQESISIEKGELVRVVWIRMPATETGNRLLIVLHHLLVDGVSWRILLEDLEISLAGVREGREMGLGEKTCSYRQWYECLRSYRDSWELQGQQSYWVRVIKGIDRLPVDREQGSAVRVRDMRTIELRLGREWTQKLLQEVPGVYHTEINDVLLSALLLSVSEWADREELLIGLEGHGRELWEWGVDTSRTVGWFTSMYPVRLSRVGCVDYGEILSSVKEQLREIPDKGIGYGVLKYMGEKREEDGAAKQGGEGGVPWDIVFNYLGQSGSLSGGMTGKGRVLCASEGSTGHNVGEDHEIDE
jgi:amino acid adenylation domain-containing protein